MKNQRGFATLEMILVILIIAVLSAVALPKAARMVDAVRLDYEMKTFLSTLDFTKSLNKNASFTTEIFQATLANAGFGSNTTSLQVNLTDTDYKIVRQGQEIFKPHQLPEGFSMSCNATLNNSISFTQANNGTLTMTSRQNFNRYIIFNSVGRWRGDITAPK
ncbi:MAG: prepilin-type N-terminal cleavage/methylation domain-containing protein [Selenomonadaceae bacterium]|nr:prepilin-type N-terminal cleavage/methylation domain-containing protein [Selenomonadaceae bacterium]